MSVDEARWFAVYQAHHIEGLTWEDSYKRASEMLAGTSARGEPDTMRQSYMMAEAVMDQTRRGANLEAHEVIQ